MPAATALRPNLVTVICGANDVLLTTRPDVEGYEAALRRRSSRRLRGALPEAAIVTGTAPESWHFMDLRPRTRKRLADATEALNAATRRIAAEHERPVPAGRRPPGARRPRQLRRRRPPRLAAAATN